MDLSRVHVSEWNTFPFYKSVIWAYIKYTAFSVKLKLYVPWIEHRTCMKILNSGLCDAVFNNVFWWSRETEWNLAMFEAYLLPKTASEYNNNYLFICVQYYYNFT